MYKFNSACGTFTIEPYLNGVYLKLDGAIIAFYPSAVAAVDAINNHDIGIDDWDNSLDFVPLLNLWSHS